MSFIVNKEENALYCNWRKMMSDFKSLVDAIKWPVFVMDTDNRISFVNEAFHRLTGFNKEEYNDIFLNPQPENLSNTQPQNLLKNIQKNKSSSTTPFLLPKKDGDILNGQLTICPEYSNEILIGFSAIFVADQNHEKISDKSSSDSNTLHGDENYKTIYNLAFEGILIHRQGNVIDVNPAFEKMLGYKKEELIGINIIDLCILPEYKHKAYDAMQQEVVEPYEVLSKRKDGKIIHVEVESRQISFNNEVLRVTALRDITERKLAEAAIKESEERYKLLSNITFEGIFLHDKGIIIDANQSLANMIGYEIDEIIGKNIIQMVVLPEYHQRVATALINEETTPYVVKVRRKDGSIFFAEVEAGMVNYKREWLRVTAARDVTWRIDAERKLRENEEELDTFFSQSGDGFFIMKLEDPIKWDPKNQDEELLNKIMENMHLTKINDAMIKQYKAKDSRIKKYTLEQFFYWNDIYGKNFTRDLLNNGSIQFEMAEPRFDNTIMWIEGNYLVLYDDEGRVRGCCGVRREISDRKKTEEAIKQHNEELKKTNQELDNFVYRVSHDLKAPISSTKGLINIALLETEKERIHTCLELIQDSMDRLDSFILDILDYSRNSRIEVDPALIDFELLIKDTLAHTKYLQQENNIEIESEINDEINFYSDRRRLVFIFNNLVSNAIRFTDEKKKKSFLKIQIVVKKGHVLITFSDNGIGIEKEHLDRIFEMFYRANDQKVGSGLGLYIVKESVERLGGSIEVESEAGIGTRFKIKLPNLVSDS